jgi:hypothetical protein
LTESLKLQSEQTNYSIGNALNYGEAQSGESPREFIKWEYVSKNLRETFINIKIIKYAQLSDNFALLDVCFKENNELIIKSWNHRRNDAGYTAIAGD